MVDEAIGRLSAGDREVVLRCYLEGLSARELAEILKMSKAAVQKRLGRAMERLLEWMRTSVTVPTMVGVLAAERGVVAPMALKAAVMKTGASGMGSVVVWELVGRSVMQVMMKKAVAVIVVSLAMGGLTTAAVMWGSGAERGSVGEAREGF